MNMEYFVKQIREESEGARDYIDKAVEAKVSHPMWSQTFCSMSEMEMSHAENLIKMLEVFIRDSKKDTTSVTSTVMPEDAFKECVKDYTEMKTYVCNMKRGL